MRQLATRHQVDSGLAELVADRDRPDAWTLLVRGTPQSHVDLGDPRHLEFEYVRRLGHLIDLAAPAGEPLRVLHLGAGGLTLARYVAATRPGSAQLAVESDAPLAELVRRRLPLNPPRRRPGNTQAGRIRVRIADARAVLEQLPPASFDVVLADLFAGPSPPAHLTWAEFDAAAARAMYDYRLHVALGRDLCGAVGADRIAQVRSDIGTRYDRATGLILLVSEALDGDSASPTTVAEIERLMALRLGGEAASAG